MPKKLEIQALPDEQPQRDQRRQARKERKDLTAALGDLTERWESLNANQQREAMRRALILLIQGQD